MKAEVSGQVFVDWQRQRPAGPVRGRHCRRAASNCSTTKASGRHDAHRPRWPLPLHVVPRNGRLPGAGRATGAVDDCRHDRAMLISRGGLTVSNVNFGLRMAAQTWPRTRHAANATPPRMPRSPTCTSTPSTQCLARHVANAVTENDRPYRLTRRIIASPRPGQNNASLTSPSSNETHRATSCDSPNNRPCEIQTSSAHTCRRDQRACRSLEFDPPCRHTNTSRSRAVAASLR